MRPSQLSQPALLVLATLFLSSLTGCVRFGFIATTSDGGQRDGGVTDHVGPGQNSTDGQTDVGANDSAGSDADVGANDSAGAGSDAGARSDADADASSDADADAQAAPGTHVLSYQLPRGAVAEALATAPNGDLVVTGDFHGTIDFGAGELKTAGKSDIFIARYSSSGAHKWSRRFGGVEYDTGTGVAVDGSGAVTVVGDFERTVDFGGGPLTHTGYHDIFVTRLSSTGTHSWSKRVGGTGTDLCTGVAVTKTGAVTVTGYFSRIADFGGGSLTSAGNNDIFVALYSSTGTHKWSKRLGGTDEDYGASVAIDSSGAVTVTGAFRKTLDFGGGTLTSAGESDIFIAHYSSAGTHQWSKRFGARSKDYGQSVTVDGNRAVTVTGAFQNKVDFGDGSQKSAGGYDIFLARYAANGTHQWSKRLGGTDWDSGRSVAAHGSGAVTVTGHFYNTVDFGGGSLTSAGDYDIFLARYAANGTHLWSKRFGGANIDNTRHVAIDAKGRVALLTHPNTAIDLGGGVLPGTGSAIAVFAP